MAFAGSQRGHPLLLSPLPLPLSSEGFPKGKAPKRRRGRIKRGAFEEMARLAAHQGRESYSHDGVRAAARPFVSFQGGAGGNRNPPAFLFRGPGGDILFSKENIPLASPYRTGTVPPGTPVIFSARRKENGDSIRCGIAAHLRTNLVRLISQKKSSAFCGEPPPLYGSSRISGILMHRGPPRPRLSSALGMAWMRMPASSKERLVTWFRV